MISLLAADLEENIVSPNPIPANAKGTLIIAPLSLLTNWTNQISQHLHADSLTSVIYHGANRSIDFTSYDVVVTSYGTLGSEYKVAGFSDKDGITNSQYNGLFTHTWKRVVLDEAHAIKNPRINVSLAVTRLESVMRWSLTGTLSLLNMRLM